MLRDCDRKMFENQDGHTYNQTWIRADSWCIYYAYENKVYVYTFTARKYEMDVWQQHTPDVILRNYMEILKMH